MRKWDDREKYFHGWYIREMDHRATVRRMATLALICLSSQPISCLTLSGAFFMSRFVSPSTTGI